MPEPFSEHLFNAVSTAFDIPPEMRGPLHRLAELDAQARALAEQEKQIFWEAIKQNMENERERINALLEGTGVSVDYVEGDDA